MTGLAGNKGTGKQRLDKQIAGAIITVSKKSAKVTGGGIKKDKKKDISGLFKQKTKKEGEGSSIYSHRVKRDAHYKCVHPSCQLLDENPISCTAHPCGLYDY